MPNELSLSVAASYSKSGEDFDAVCLDLIGQSITVAGSNHIHNTVTATTSAAALPLGSVVTCGLLIGRNRGAIAVHIRVGSGGSDAITFPAGKGYAVYLATSTPYIVAASSTSKFEYILIEA